MRSQLDFSLPSLFPSFLLPLWVCVAMTVQDKYPVRSPFLIFMTVYLLLFLFIWFLVEVIIHSEPQSTSDDSFYVQLTLAEMSLQLFLYCCLLCFFSLAAAWYSDLQRTKAARASAAIATTFAKSTWLLHSVVLHQHLLQGLQRPQLVLWRRRDIQQPDTVTNTSDWCNLSRSVAVPCVMIGAGLIAVWVWTIINRFARITPEVPIPTRGLHPSSPHSAGQ